MLRQWDTGWRLSRPEVLCRSMINSISVYYNRQDMHRFLPFPFYTPITPPSKLRSCAYIPWIIKEQWIYETALEIMIPRWRTRSRKVWNKYCMEQSLRRDTANNLGSENKLSSLMKSIIKIDRSLILPFHGSLFAVIPKNLWATPEELRAWEHTATDLSHMTASGQHTDLFRAWRVHCAHKPSCHLLRHTSKEKLNGINAY